MIEKIKNWNWTRIVYIIGVIAFIIGTIDPLEGSVLIAGGSALIALATWFRKDRHWKIFLTSALMVLFGVFFLFYFSSLGGFPPVSLWWGILILPYPIAWFMIVITLIRRAIKKKKKNNSDTRFDFKN